MESNSQLTDIEPNRNNEVTVPDFSEHKELLQHFFNQESVDALNIKEKQVFLNKLKTSLAS